MLERSLGSLFLLFQLFTLIFGHHGEVTVYNDENFQGAQDTYILYPYECEDVDPVFANYISSIKPSSTTCVQIYKGRGCPEDEIPIKMKEYSLGHDKLAKIGFNDQVRSMKLC